MNRLLVSLLVIILVMIIADCRKNPAMPKESGVAAEKSGAADHRGATDTQSDSLRLDSLFDRIRLQEAAIAAYPSNERLVKELLGSALDSSAGCVYSIGKGTIDTALPATAQPVSQKIAAKYSAEKWALYCKAWLSGEKIPYGAPISGKVLYEKNLRARMKNDTLFLLLMVPVGSVVVKKAKGS